MGVDTGGRGRSVGRRRGRKGSEGVRGKGPLTGGCILTRSSGAFLGTFKPRSASSTSSGKLLVSNVVLRGRRGHPMHLLVLFRKMLQHALDWLMTFPFLDVPVHALLEVPLAHPDVPSPTCLEAWLPGAPLIGIFSSMVHPAGQRSYGGDVWGDNRRTCLAAGEISGWKPRSVSLHTSTQPSKWTP